jgi:hypothetical protein
VRIHSNSSLEMLPGMLEILNVRGFATTFSGPLHTGNIHASDSAVVTTVVTARSIRAADILTYVEVRVIVRIWHSLLSLSRVLGLPYAKSRQAYPSQSYIPSLNLRGLGDRQLEVDV